MSDWKPREVPLDARPCLDELDTLRLRLAACERERDEAKRLHAEAESDLVRLVVAQRTAMDQIVESLRLLGHEQVAEELAGAWRGKEGA